MNLREYVVLDVLNIASTQYGFFKKEEHRRVYRATAKQCATVLAQDERFERERLACPELLDSYVMGATLRGLAKGHPTRRRQCVTRTQTGHWSLTEEGLDVLVA